MTKPREKTREELTAEIEDGKKKIWQLENREKMLRDPQRRSGNCCTDDRGSKEAVYFCRRRMCDLRC